MLPLIVGFLLATSSATHDLPPTAPIPRDWPGGPWTGDDADKGKTFPRGAFPYVPRKEHDAYQKTLSKWLDSHPAAQEKMVNAKIGYDLFGLHEGLAAVKPVLDSGAPKLKGSGPLAAYGGTGTVAVEYSYPAGRVVTIDLAEVDVEKTLAAIGLRTPIRVTGTTGKLVGRIEGDYGHFVGTENRTRGDLVQRIELTVDLARGTWASTAETSYGRQTFTGRLRAVK